MTRKGCLALLASSSLAGASASVGAADLPNPFFAMDTGTRDAQHQTPEAQAKRLKELGYAGIGWSPGAVPETVGRGRRTLNATGRCAPVFSASALRGVP